MSKRYVAHRGVSGVSGVRYEERRGVSRAGCEERRKWPSVWRKWSSVWVAVGAVLLALLVAGLAGYTLMRG